MASKRCRAGVRVMIDINFLRAGLIVRVLRYPWRFFWIVRPLPGRPVRDTSRGSTPHFVAGDRWRPGRHQLRDARLIRGVGLGRFGLLGEEVGVFLERRLAEDLSRERRVSEIFDSRRLSASKKAPFSDDDAGASRRLP